MRWSAVSSVAKRPSERTTENCQCELNWKTTLARGRFDAVVNQKPDCSRWYERALDFQDLQLHPSPLSTTHFRSPSVVCRSQESLRIISGPMWVFSPNLHLKIISWFRCCASFQPLYLCPTGLKLLFQPTLGHPKHLCFSSFSLDMGRRFAHWFGVLAPWTVAQIPVRVPTLWASEWNEIKKARRQETYDHTWTIKM